MFTRLTQFTLVATLGMLLSVAFAGTAMAEVYMPPGYTPPQGPDVTLVSPAAVEAPTTIVLSSPQPDVEVIGCSKVGTSENCYPYLVGRSGPDASGRYLSEWRLPMAPTGAIELGVGANSFGTFGTLVTFTVTGNRFSYTDFRSCTREEVAVYHPVEWYRNHPNVVPVSQVLVDYYAQVNTSLTYQLQRKVRTKTNRWLWVAAKDYQPQTFPIAHSELGEGYGPFERRETKQNVPLELLYPSKRPAPKYRVAYFITKGKKLLKQGVVSRKPCQKIDDPPYYIP